MNWGGICPVCFGRVAIERGKLIAHRYLSRPIWHSRRTGDCLGSGCAPFGTAEGRQLALEEFQRGEDYQVSCITEAQAVRAGLMPVPDKPEANPFERSQYALHLEVRAQMAGNALIGLRNRINRPIKEGQQ